MYIHCVQTFIMFILWGFYICFLWIFFLLNLLGMICFSMTSQFSCHHVQNILLFINCSLDKLYSLFLYLGSTIFCLVSLKSLLSKHTWLESKRIWVSFTSFSCLVLMHCWSYLILVFCISGLQSLRELRGGIVKFIYSLNQWT